MSSREDVVCATRPSPWRTCWSSTPWWHVQTRTNSSPGVPEQPSKGAYKSNNPAEARNRLRLRVRFGAEAKLGETVTAGLRLTTGSVGNGSDPSTENQNLGNYNTRSTVGFDRAY